MDAPINRNSGIPVYQQLAAILQAQIEAGTLTGRLPAEVDLAADWGVSHGTLRAALDLLRQAGLVRTARGLGTWVLPPGERGPREA